ncbi:mucin-binding protein [Streptococcus mitis]|uniref:mucin-binding protein n=1 Tax=Streptococcus mitis TaxID=28037 RepID=UPI000992B46E|nr:YSIRK-type signal peptide-containing protein [Streptococcus mitis]
MGKFDKQLKYSIRKVSVGAASVVIGALYLAMGAGVVHAETNTTTDGGASHSSPSPEPETSQPNSLTSSSYGAEPAQNPDASGKSTESTTPKEKENKETLATNNTKPVENKEINNVLQPTEASTSANTRGRRVRREVGDAPAGGTSNTSTGNNEALNSALTGRKGATVKPDQPGVNIPKGEEPGAHDPNANLSFDDPDHTATVEDMWKIIQHMPDDFQNNERSYLKNMDTLGRELRFDKTAENPEGVPLKPGEIRELHDFGGWHAIDEDGNKGKFAIGRKNAQGYFTGWRKVGETPEGIPIMEQGGMLGADALDNIYVHEQALDRRFDYMLMLVKGRTRANRNDTVADNSTYDPRAQNERAEAAGANYNKLPFLERDTYNKYSPAVVGYNGIEKKFTAFSTKYGSRVRVDFVTGYITDINGSKGSYRVVIKAQNSKGEETKVYDETISRVAEIVQNEELYKKGLNVEAAHANILKFLKDEFNYRVNKILNPKIKNSPLNGIKKTDYDSEQQKLYDQIVEEATEEAKKQGDIVMNVTEDFLSIAKSWKRDSEWKKTFTNTQQSPIKLSNDLNNLLKNADKDNPNTPTWISSASSQAKADDRAYRLLTTLIPGAKKITYHVNDDQLEVETDKYTYTAARNGSQEVGIQGSNIAATLSADVYGANSQTFDSENTNTKVNNLNHGWARAGSEEFKHFSHFIGVDKGIERTNVISDEELSAKIKEAVGPGYSKLGKPGYFSTADIPLGTDVVSYTVQVIPSDDGRVGVNPQSSRIQYNMPILADFSVIQDTVEPSKELAKRILTKLKEQGKITEDQEKKIKEEIDKSKKTSEVRTAMSGDVTVRYVDTDGNNLPITDADAKKAGEKTDNGYLVRKDVLIGTDYDVHSKKVLSFNATNGKYYALRSVGGGLETSSDTLNGSITKKNTVITFVYEERTVPPTGKGVVHFKKQVSETATEALTEYGDITLSGNVGDTFSSTDVNTRITALKKAGYEIVSDTFTNGDKIIDSTTDEDGQEPSQVYNVIVREKVETVTTPPIPNTPVDPNVPEGPKWPATGLAKSDLEKEVTRTITYVKKDTADGPEIPDAKPTKKQTAHFKRSATYNVVTGTITYGNWESTDKELAKVDTPTLTGYVADKASVDKVETNADSTGLDQKVVYTKLGSWVPKVPGVETPTPLPYPNHPTDPTKPGDPTDPNVPVIPYVPGYTPKIGETPLEPVDPNNPENGYKVPPIPNTPGEDTPIEYSKDPQKAVVKVFNTTTGTEVELPEEKVELSGKTGEPIPADSVTAKIADLEKRGYIVENKDLLKDQKFDKEKDPTDGDPTQVFKLLVKERTVTVTEPKNPNDPVDPDKPEGPKWPATGLAKSDLEKEVTRTITYVKKETADGPEIADAKPTKKQTAHFKRSATYNLVTKVVTPGEWTSTDKTLEAVPTEKLDGYVANVSSVEEVETNVNSTNLDRKVVYTKLGSWIPKVPGVETPTPIPYPNHPTDPTKPGNPTDPNVPVIPYVPGYTPKIGETPLEPKVPNDPTQGYIPPAVPTEPGTNTDITYVADSQKAVVKVFNTTTGTEVELPTEKVSIDNGTTDAAIPTDSVTAKIADLEKRGYIVENKDLLKDQKFDKEKDPTDGDPTQVFKLLVKERTVTVTEPKNPNDPVDPDKPEGPKWPATGLAKSDLEKEVTRTITYVKKETADGPEISDAKPTKKQTAHFKRSETYNLVTKVVTPGEWTSTDKTLEAVPTEKLDGYVANVSSVEEVETNVNSTNLDRKVVYTKLGSWIPKVPGVETPTPIPYPNHPTDPTKPGDPTDPNVPVIPYVPGYTPKTPDGNPLVPKVPNDPTQGYIPPAVPTEPGKDTPIEYVKVPNTPSPEEPVKPTPESNHITIWVDENGKPLKPEKPGTHEPGNIPGYRFITTTTKDGVTIHKFEKITPVEPNNPVPQKPTTPIPTPQDPTIPTPESQIPTPNTPEANTPTSETSRREELPNTGTEANANLGALGLLGALSGFVLLARKKKED